MIKKILLLTPLVISGCSKGKVIYNVAYYFDTDKMQYAVVEYNEKLDKELARYWTTADKVYTVYVYSYVEKNNELINNEFYVGTKELFVYYKR